MPEQQKTDRIRMLNDELRTRHIGGRIVATCGIAMLGEERIVRVLAAIAAFTAFTPDNDPHGEHDCAVMEVEGETIIWKIDYYDVSLQFLSTDPSNPAETRRIMTVMLSSEY